MTSWMRNQVVYYYNAISPPMTATHDALPERLQSVCEADSLLYNWRMSNIEYGREGWKT